MTRYSLTVGAYGVNCSVLVRGSDVWVVDPGSEAVRIAAFLETRGLAPTAVLLTHAHFDHIGGIAGLQARWPGLPVYMHPGDEDAFGHPLNQALPDYPPADRPGEVRDCRSLAGVTVVETPGHTPGGVCYFFPAADGGTPLLLSGDTLFAGSVGRTDFPGGDMATLMASLGKLRALPPETVVVPGHGPETTLAREFAGNPFLMR